MPSKKTQELFDELIKEANHIWDSRTHLDVFMNAKPEQKEAFNEELELTMREMEEFRKKYLRKIVELSILNKRMLFYLIEAEKVKGDENE